MRCEALNTKDRKILLFPTGAGIKNFSPPGNVLFATRLSKASASGFRRKYFRVHVAGVLYNVRHGHHNYEHENPQQPTGGTGHHADVQFFDWAVYVKD